MIGDIVAEFTKFGPGWTLIILIIVGLCIAIGVMWKHIIALQNRIYDIQKSQMELIKEINRDVLEMTDEHNRAMTSMTIVIQSLKDYVVVHNVRG